MRFFDLSATVLAAAAVLSGVTADAPPAYGVASSSAAPATSAAASATATTTYYVTRTVIRVVETVTATGNGTASAYTTTMASTAAVSTVKPLPSHYGNPNATTLYASGTGSNRMPTATYVSPPPSTGSAGKLEALSFVAALGLVALAL